MNHLRYLRYLIRHKWFVFVAGLKTGAPLWRLLIHDWSKFTRAEWGPYVRRFYGGGGNDEEFRKAWLHHIEANDHHWENWCPTERLRLYLGRHPRVNFGRYAHEMPEPAIREMVADWMGAGRAITGRWCVHHWYERNKDEMILHPETREMVERVLSGVEP